MAKNFTLPHKSFLNLMMRILFSIHYGDSIAHILRTRGIAQIFSNDGHEVLYLASKRAKPYLASFLEEQQIVFNNQNYGYSRLESFNNLQKKICDRAEFEYEIFCSFTPHIVIGDMGLIASVFCTESKLIKIINRFFVDLSLVNKSSFPEQHRKLLIKQIELLVNNARKKIGIKQLFTYNNFIQGKILLNGSPELIGNNINSACVNIGTRLAININKNSKQHDDVVFIFLGTGFGLEKNEILKNLVLILKNKFRKIYISVGRIDDLSQIIFPDHCIVKQFFSIFPSDVGLIICHGGYAAIHTALALGIPVLVIPFHVEHFSNGVAVERLNRGRNFGILIDNKFSGINQRYAIDWVNFEREINNPTMKKYNPYRIKMATDNSLYNDTNSFL